jgi:histidinol-phosphate/aromatic aminotransferase/cobyric acid decarboxylase-like protein
MSAALLSRFKTVLPVLVGFSAAQHNTGYCDKPHQSNAFARNAYELARNTMNEPDGVKSAVLKWLPEHVLKTPKYTSGTLSNYSKKLIQLGLNESPIDGREGKPLHEYPERDDANLVAALKQLYSAVRWDECKLGVSVGTGSSQFIEIVVDLAYKRSIQSLLNSPDQRAFNRVVCSQLTYAAYPETLAKHGLVCIPVANNEAYEHNLDSMLNAIDEHTSLVLIDNPCNPSGTLIATEKIDGFMRCLNQKPYGLSVWVVLDEAYLEFAEHGLPENERNQSVKLLEKYPNLIILRTASKYYGLASVRCGYAMGQSLLLDQIDKFKAACPVTVQAQQEFLKAIQNQALYAQNAAKVANNRQRLIQTVLSSGVLPMASILHSHASFVLFFMPKDIAASDLKSALYQGSLPIDVKAFPKYNAVRMSVISDAKQMEVAGNALVNILRRLQTEKGNAPKASNVQEAADSAP